jgi:hypothetical protein
MVTFLTTSFCRLWISALSIPPPPHPLQPPPSSYRPRLLFPRPSFPLFRYPRLAVRTLLDELFEQPWLSLRGLRSYRPFSPRPHPHLPCTTKGGKALHGQERGAGVQGLDVSIRSKRYEILMETLGNCCDRTHCRQGRGTAKQVGRP